MNVSFWTLPIYSVLALTKLVIRTRLTDIKNQSYLQLVHVFLLTKAEVNKSRTICLILCGGHNVHHCRSYCSHIFHIIMDIFSLLCDIYPNKCLQSFSLEPPEIVVIYF